MFATLLLCASKNVTLLVVIFAVDSVIKELITLEIYPDEPSPRTVDVRFGVERNPAVAYEF